MQWARNMVKALLRPHGLRFSREPRIFLERPELRLEFSLQHVLAMLAAEKRDVFFVQIGANDGKTDDPLFQFVDRFGWHGLLLEPQPDVFKKLCKNYEGRCGIALKCAAISEVAGTRPMFTLPDMSVDGVRFQGNTLASFERDSVLQYRTLWPDVEDHIQEVSVECVTWTDLITEFKITRADLVVIDTEGFDYDVLRMLPIDQLRVSVVLMEHVHLSTKERRAAWDLLAAHGFRLLIHATNTAATRKL